MLVSNEQPDDQPIKLLLSFLVVVLFVTLVLRRAR